jgi:putative membrane protein
MKTLCAIAAASALFISPALAQSTDEFVKKVAISDMFEIEAAQMALDKGADRDTKPFAQKMIKDHTKTSKELKALVEKGKVKAEIPSALDPEHKKKLDDMKGLSGKDFDSAYDKAQVDAHQQAVSLFETYAKSGDNPDLKKWAAKTLPHLKQHLSMAQKLK